MSETTTTGTQSPPEGGEPIEEGAYATINPATCGGRIEIQCSAMGCEETAGLVLRTDMGARDVPTAIPYCNQHHIDATTTPAEHGDSRQ